MIERLRYLKRMFHSHSFFGWKGYFHLVDLQCKIQNATGTELWNLYEEQHKIMYDYIDRNLKQHRMMDYTGCRAVKNDIDDQNIWVCCFLGIIAHDFQCSNSIYRPLCYYTYWCNMFSSFYRKVYSY